MEKIFRIGFLIGCFTVAFSSCRQLNPFVDEEVVAKVGETKLYLSEVKSIFKYPIQSHDSLKLLEQYVDSWVKRQLKIQQAERLFPEAAPDIERMIEEYRSSLLTHKLDQYYVDSKIDTLLTDSDIETYYNDHRTDFVLDRNIVKGTIVELPYNHRQKDEVKKLMGSSGDKYQDFLELSRKNGFAIHEIKSWMDFSDFLNLLPTNKLRDYEDLLGKAGVHEMRNDNVLYYVLITSYFKKDDAGPIDRVTENIRRIIINQRRQDIIRNYEDSIYNLALDSKMLEINIKR